MPEEKKPKPKARKQAYRPTGGSRTPEVVRPERELVLVAKSDAGLRAKPDGAPAAEGADVAPLTELLGHNDIVVRPLFGESEERLIDKAATLASETGLEIPDLSVYYRVEASEERLDELAESLNALDMVEGAYVAPPVELPQILNDMVASAEVPPINTPDFTSRQGYLNQAPGGVDARYAWTRPGGRGAGVRIIDVEGAWRFSHEDLLQNQGGVVGGTQSSDLGWRNHGTAVSGEFGGDRNNFGITGICPNANVRAISVFGGVGAAGAIRLAADMLGPGDIILIELHRPGPRHNFQLRGDQRGYIAIEWWPADYAAIRYAISRGVIIVEAAGNGAENLDDSIYDQRPAGFPPSWRNPFNPANPSSGAIIVGAGAPPPGTHGRNHGPDRSRLDFSNYGVRVDAQGWGREVTTTGYGDLQGGNNEDEWYTDMFSGTSSASPIVVGALGCIQGVLRNLGRRLNPASAQNLLRSTGSPQQDATGRPRTQRIGNRPNLRQMIQRVAPIKPRLVKLFRYWNARGCDHFYTTNWGELGQGRHGWKYEGIQCYVFPQRVRGTVPLFRYWNPGGCDHFYTTNWGELGQGKYGWKYEGIQCYVFPQRVRGTVPLFRYWNPGGCDHFYTTNWGELGQGRHGWRYEGVQCYVFPLRRSVTPPAEELLGVTYDVNDFSSEPYELEPVPDDAHIEDTEAIPGTFELEPEYGPTEYTEPVPGTFEVEPEYGPTEYMEPVLGTFEVEPEYGPTEYMEEVPGSFEVEPEGVATEYMEEIPGTFDVAPQASRVTEIGRAGDVTVTINVKSSSRR